MAPNKRIRHLLPSVALLALYQSGICANAAVPPSVAVRQQSPDVEQIIQAMEAKAASAQGTWITKSGRQDVPAEEWEIVSQQQEWSLKSLASNALTKAPPALMYFDGENYYTLPDAVRFQNDTFHRGTFQELGLSQYILLLNQHPRQLIGSMGNLQILGPEAINGISCTHLQANPKQDSVLKADTAVAFRTRPLPVIDVYYDSQHQAIVKTSITSVEGYRWESIVSAWDDFHTKATWPKTIVGKSFHARIATSTEIGKPVLTDVVAFTPGQPEQLDGIKKTLNATTFFSAPLHDLRSTAYYKKAVADKPDSLSDKVALAQAAFNDGDAQNATQQWSDLDAKLPSPGDREALRTVLLPHASYCLWQASTVKEQASSCVSLMKKLLNDLSDDQRAQICSSLFGAWHNLITNPTTRSTVSVLNSELLAEFSIHGNFYVFSSLINLSNNNFYAGMVLPYLRAPASKPLPSAGYSGSQLSVLIAATLQEHDFDTADGYLNGINWSSNTPDASKDIAQDLQVAVKRMISMKKNGSGGLADIMQSFSLFASPKYSKDPLTVSATQIALVFSGGEYVLHLLNSDEQNARSLIRQTNSVGNANIYWRDIISGLVNKYQGTPGRLMEHVGPFFHAYAEAFNEPDYEVNQWIQLALTRKGYWGMQVDYLNKAIVAAKTDAMKYKVIYEMAQVYAGAREFALGVQAVEGLASTLQDPVLAKQAQQLARRLKADGQAAQQRALVMQSRIEQEDEKARVAFMQSQLSKAKAKGASDDDIASIQKAIEQLDTSATDDQKAN